MSDLSDISQWLCLRLSDPHEEMYRLNFWAPLSHIWTSLLADDTNTWPITSCSNTILPLLISVLDFVVCCVNVTFGLGEICKAEWILYLLIANDWLVASHVTWSYYKFCFILFLLIFGWLLLRDHLGIISSEVLPPWITSMFLFCALHCAQQLRVGFKGWCCRSLLLVFAAFFPFCLCVFLSFQWLGSNLLKSQLFVLDFCGDPEHLICVFYLGFEVSFS